MEGKVTGPRGHCLSEQEQNSGLGDASPGAVLPWSVQRPDIKQMKILRGVTFRFAIFFAVFGSDLPNHSFPNNSGPKRKTSHSFALKWDDL